MSTCSEPSHDHAHDPQGLGPCGKPCDQPCDEADGGCDQLNGELGALGHVLERTLFNAMDVCFDEVQAEPKRMLIVGGCRQRRLAQHLALLRPGTEIVLVDPSENEARQAEADICCRFKFIAAPMEALPFENESFDLTIAHNYFAFPENWGKGVDELCRVTKSNLLISHHRPLLWGVFGGIKPLQSALAAQGMKLPKHLPEKFDLQTRLYKHTRTKSCLAPFPWTMYMTAMKPVREERLVLAD